MTVPALSPSERAVPKRKPKLSRRWIYTIALDDDGRIPRSYAVLATNKLTAISFE